MEQADSSGEQGNLRGRDTGPGTSSGSGRLDRRTVLRTSAGGVIGVSLAGCVNQVDTVLGDDSTDPVKVGVLAPSPNKDLIGMSTANGVRLAAQEINAGEGFAGIPNREEFVSGTSMNLERVRELEQEGEGAPPPGLGDVSLDTEGFFDPGILGRDVEVVVRDTKGSAPETRRRYQELVIEEDVDLTLGIFQSEALDYVMEDMAQAETLHITVGSASDYPNTLINQNYDRYKYHFRIGPFNNALLIQNQLDFIGDMAGELGWSNLGVLTEDLRWADRLGPAFESFLPQIGMDVAEVISYSPETSDFTDLYQQIADAGADGLLVGMSHTGDQALIDWFEMKPPFNIGGIHIPAQRPDYYFIVDGACRYTIGQTIATDTMELPAVQNLVDAYSSNFGGQVPMFTGYSAYTAMLVYALCAESAGTTNSETVIPTMEALTFDSPTGPLEFYERNDGHAHDPKYGPEYIQGIFFQWQENESGGASQEVIWPERFATADYVEPPWI